jgi:hypothetical protein
LARASCSSKVGAIRLAGCGPGRVGKGARRRLRSHTNRSISSPSPRRAMAVQRGQSAVPLTLTPHVSGSCCARVDSLVGWCMGAAAVTATPRAGPGRGAARTFLGQAKVRVHLRAAAMVAPTCWQLPPECPPAAARFRRPGFVGGPALGWPEPERWPCRRRRLRRRQGRPSRS